MTWELWILYLLAAVGLSLTPGPNGLLALAHGARFGFRRAIATVLGGALGFFLLIAASLAGLGALLVASERAFIIAKLLGAAYLIYLGIRLWRLPAPVIAPVPPPEPARDSAAKAGALSLFAEGFLVAVSNPKAILFFAAFLPQFMTPGAPFLLQLAVMGGTFVAVEILYELVIAGLAQRIAPWLARHGRMFNRVTGVTFMGIGATLATAQR